MNKGTAGQRGRIPPPGTVLAVLVVILLALGAAALSAAHGSAAHGSGPLAGQWWLLAAAAIFGGIAVISRLRRLVRGAETGSTAEARLHRGALALTAVATAAVPVALFLLHGADSGGDGALCTTCPIALHSGTQPAATQHPVVPTATAHPAPVKLPLGIILLILGSVLGALLIGALLVTLMQWWSRRGRPGIEGAPPPAPPEDEQDASALGMAVLAGRDALAGEARAAIIGCYAAMENSLAAAGVPRLASDSPADLLARATAHGVLDGPAPRLLAALFREARFSSHAMGSRHLDQARGALDEIAAQLEARAAAETAAAELAATDDADAAEAAR